MLMKGVTNRRLRFDTIIRAPEGLFTEYGAFPRSAKKKEVNEDLGT